MFSAVAEHMGMDYDTAVKVAGGFGGGMYLNSACGAVTGAIMAIGLKYGGATQQAGIRTAAVVRQFGDQFKARHKTINCSALTGIDLSTIDIGNPEALQAAYKDAIQKGVFDRCATYVKDATTIAAEILSV